MQVSAQVALFFRRLASLIAGILFLYLSIAVIGYSAQFSMSSELILTILKFSETLAFSLSGFLTVGIPLSILFVVLTCVLTRTIGVCYCFDLALPFLALTLLGLLDTYSSGQLDLNYTVLMTIQNSPLVLTIIYLSKRKNSVCFSLRANK